MAKRKRPAQGGAAVDGADSDHGGDPSNNPRVVIDGTLPPEHAEWQRQLPPTEKGGAVVCGETITGPDDVNRKLTWTGSRFLYNGEVFDDKTKVCDAYNRFVHSEAAAADAEHALCEASIAATEQIAALKAVAERAASKAAAVKAYLQTKPDLKAKLPDGLAMLEKRASDVLPILSTGQFCKISRHVYFAIQRKKQNDTESLEFSRDVGNDGAKVGILGTADDAWLMTVHQEKDKRHLYELQRPPDPTKIIYDFELESVKDKDGATTIVKPAHADAWRAFKGSTPVTYKNFHATAVDFVHEHLREQFQLVVTDADLIVIDSSGPDGKKQYEVLTAHRRLQTDPPRERGHSQGVLREYQIVGESQEADPHHRCRRMRQ